MLFGGLMVVFYLYMSRYVDLPFTKTMKALTNTEICRYLFLVTLVYTGTKSILETCLIISVIILLHKFILNQKSNFCIKSKLTSIIDENEDGKIDAAEIDKVIGILQTMRSRPQNIGIED
tara:strand:+ start:334 stop:693 length:360 start_codon:yes stop_codon:yes gene_type:complete